MSMTRKEMKQTAKAGLRSANPHPLPVTLVYVLMTNVVGLVVPCIMVLLSGAADVLYWIEQGYRVNEVLYYYMGAAGTAALIFTNILIGLYSAVVTFGYTGYNLRASRRDEVGFGNLLEGFGMAGRVILLNFLIGLFTFLWSLLFIIPGIAAFYRYRMAYFILLDDPECGALEAIRMSKTMMKGQKMNLFVFDISFFNWVLPYIPIAIIGGLLSSYSVLLGIAAGYVLSALLFLWITPYVLCSQAVFYDAISDEKVWPRRKSRSSGPDVRF